MEKGPNWRHYITIILYDVHKLADPVHQVEEYLSRLRRLDIDLHPVLSDIQEGLASKVRIARILPGPHSEKTIRRFFTLLAEKLEAELR